jgi:hypothetical protein
MKHTWALARRRRLNVGPWRAPPPCPQPQPQPHALSPGTLNVVSPAQRHLALFVPARSTTANPSTSKADSTTFLSQGLVRAQPGPPGDGSRGCSWGAPGRRWARWQMDYGGYHRALRWLSCQASEQPASNCIAFAALPAHLAVKKPA